MILKFLDSISQLLVILPLIALFLFFSQYLFPKHNQKITKAADTEVKVKTLDARFSYQLEEVVELFSQLGPEGRKLYRKLESGVDMIFPLVYGFMFLAIYAFFFKSLFGPESPLLYLAFLPAATMIFDYIENTSIIRLLDHYDQLTGDMVAFTSTFTSIKYVLFVISLAGILLYGAILGIRWLIHQF